MKTTLQRHNEYVAKLEKAHIPMTSYACPADRCGFVIRTVRPVAQEYYDKITECPDCGCQHFIFVCLSGLVEAELLYGGVA